MGRSQLRVEVDKRPPLLARRPREVSVLGAEVNRRPNHCSRFRRLRPLTMCTLVFGTSVSERSSERISGVGWARSGWISNSRSVPS